MHQEGYTTSFIENKTDHQLNFYYYSKGKEFMDQYYYKSIVVSPNEYKKILAASLDSGSGVYPEIIRASDIDSLVVKYDNVKSSIHYNSSIQKQIGAGGIGFEEKGNLFNEKNWTKNVLKDTRKKYQAEYTYTFTEQDYIDAK